MIDGLGRNIDYIRVSVTDRCQLRCVYCMPEEGVPLLAHQEILTFDEITRLCGIFGQLGISKIKVTGGEPLCRRGLPALIGQLKSVPGISQVTLTTNGVDLARHWDDLCSAGLDGVNISLDTVDRELFHKLTRRDRLEDALHGVRLAANSGKMPVKVNCVPMDREQKLWDVAELARDYPVHVRFIEMMPLGCGKEFAFISREETMAFLQERFGPLTADDAQLGNGPAEYFTLPDFQGNIGFISAVSHAFCHACNRVRLTATGYLKTCLQYEHGVDLRKLLRSGGSDREIQEAVVDAIRAKPGAHHFSGRETGEDEKKTMSQIGG